MKQKEKCDYTILKVTTVNILGYKSFLLCIFNGLPYSGSEISDYKGYYGIQTLS